MLVHEIRTMDMCVVWRRYTDDEGHWIVGFAEAIDNIEAVKLAATTWRVEEFPIHDCPFQPQSWEVQLRHISRDGNMVAAVDSLPKGERNREL
ncbi:hypothetical protein V6N11_083702 [Hibiscus sabdariffa]|uniref:Uncharacterized protein n=1 Tax=Hibiscus sabdariffa TaxID=183260 RepID=A0ABR2QCT1_9ROSI